jgi:hypothetical protein
VRTDCKIDGRAIKCPNANLSGFGLGVAKPGHLIVYKEHYADGTYRTRAARVLGRVSAPTLGPAGSSAPDADTGAVRGFALVAALSDDMTHAYERWINPADIIEVRENPTAFAAFFFGAELPDAGEMRRAMRDGSICDRYISEYQKRLEAGTLWQWRSTYGDRQEVQS